MMTKSTELIVSLALVFLAGPLTAPAADLLLKRKKREPGTVARS